MREGSGLAAPQIMIPFLGCGLAGSAFHVQEMLAAAAAADDQEGTARV
jgi:hypothetical protein